MKQLRVQHTFLSLCSVCLIIFSKSIVRKDISRKDVEPFIYFSAYYRQYLYRVMQDMIETMSLGHAVLPLSFTPSAS
jgi:hypothetical protein